MTEWKEVRDSNAAMLTDSEDGWTEALASPKSEIRSPFSEAASDSFVDVGVTGHSSPERSVSPFSLVSTEPERFVPENRQELAHEEGSQDESAHDDNPFDDDDSPEDDDDDDDEDAGEIPEDFDTGDIGDWDTRSVHTITARKKEREETIAADELLAIQMAEQIRREIMDAEVARWIEQAPFPDDFDITFENLLAHGLISPEVLETLDQVDPSGLNPKYRYVEKETEVKPEPLAVDLGATDLEALNTGTLPLNIKPKASIPPKVLVTYSEDTKTPKKEEETPVYPPKATEPEGPLVLNLCGICKGYYRPAENPLVSTLASPSSFKSPYFDPNQASPFPFGLDLNCPAMHGSCIDCMEKHIINQLKIGDRMAFPIRCPACVMEEDDQDIDRDDRPTKGFVWEVHDALAEKILGHKSMELWRERKEQERHLYLSLNQPQIIQNFDENHSLIESIIVLKVVEPELAPPKITPASLQSGAIWTTGRELEANREPNLAQCKICMENTFLVTYPSIASQIAPRGPWRAVPAYGLELECPNSHAFCAPCLTKYVNECMSNAHRGSKVMCPACAGDMAAAVSGESDDWEEGKEITNEVVGRFLNEQGLAKWGVWKARLAARSDRSFVCPNAECGKDLEIQVATPEYDRGQCAECETKVCLECRAMWHDGLSCAENKALLAPEDKLFYSFAKKRLMRRCPQCQMVVAKDPGGCNRVTCVCGYQFCWRCGGLYRSVKTDFQGCNGLCPEWVEDKTLLPVESEARASSSSSMEE